MLKRDSVLAKLGLNIRKRREGRKLTHDIIAERAGLDSIYASIRGLIAKDLEYAKWTLVYWFAVFALDESVSISVNLRLKKADVFSKKKRSEVMSRIRSRGNQNTGRSANGVRRR